jgi:hypothetical protein
MKPVVIQYSSLLPFIQDVLSYRRFFADTNVSMKRMRPGSAIIPLFFFVAGMVAFVPDALLGNLTTIATLFAYVLVSIAQFAGT